MNETSKTYLDEEKYQRNARTVGNVSKILFLIAVVGAGILIFFGVRQIVTTAKRTSPEGIAELQAKVDEEARPVRERKSELMNKGVMVSTDYNDEEGYELHVLNRALDPSFNYCSNSSELQNNKLTSKYCAAKNDLEDAQEDTAQHYALSVPFFVGALMILMIFGTLGLQALLISKGREVAAFGAQQGMPVVKEGAEKLGPTMEKTAKHITKGIKDGLKD